MLRVRSSVRNVASNVATKDAHVIFNRSYRHSPSVAIKQKSQTNDGKVLQIQDEYSVKSSNKWILFRHGLVFGPQLIKGGKTQI